jgi:PAS domain S-box-containing protein
MESKRRVKAEAILKKRGNEEEIEGDTSRLIHELEVHQIELEMQNEELRRSQVDLEVSRSKYSDLFDFAPIGYFVFDDKGLILEANLTGANLLGMARGHIIKKPFSLFIVREDRDKFSYCKNNVIQTRTGQTCEIRLLKKDKTEFYAQLECEVVRETLVDSVQIRAALFDITERKEADEARWESEERLKSLFHNIPIPTYTWQRKENGFELIDYNIAAETITKGKVSKFIGATVSEMYPDNPEIIKDMKQCFRTKKTIKKEMLYHFKSIKETKYLDVSYAFAPPDFVMVHTEDITERKTIMDELEASNRLKDLFIDIMRHDLLNPAGIIKGFAELALEDDAEGEIEKALQSILKNSEKVIDLVEDASILAKLESGEKLNFEEKDLGYILKNEVNDAAHIAQEKGMEIRVNPRGKFFARVNTLIGAVISNLLNNAIKYGSKGSIVEIGIKEDGPNWRISVSNQGPGVPDSHKKEIFERFLRLKKGGVKGIGLGLAIVKKVVEIHKGEVWIEDNPDGGSIFIVKIPRKIRNIVRVKPQGGEL